MKKILYVFLFILLLTETVQAQVTQPQRYEMEKKNSDDFFVVETVDNQGVLIVRDTNKEFSFSGNPKGDTWQITALDTDLQEKWQHELEFDYDLVFKGYEIKEGVLYLLLRDGQFEKNDYQLKSISFATGEINTYEIENEVTLDLSHITVVEDVLILAGYVRFSPTLVSYKIGDNKKLKVIPGFFKDRSDVIDLRSNGNGTFTVLTLEKEYNGYFLRLRTYAKSGDILFEKQIEMASDYRVLSATVSGFIDGNIVITGSYGGGGSFYSQGIYFAVVKPENQKNTVNYIDFTEINHFFDYMRPKRAARIKRKIERKKKAGIDYKYKSRLLLHNLIPTEDGFLLSAEVYDPRYQKTNRTDFDNNYFNTSPNNDFNRSNFRYIRQPNRLVSVDDADHFEFLEAIILKLNKQGKLIWDGSLSIDDVESAALEPVVDFTFSLNDVLMLYKNEEVITYKKFVGQDSVFQENIPIRLIDEMDEIKNNYDLIGGTQYWYNNNFIVWGYHKVDNETKTGSEKRRQVLFINKVSFD